MPIGRILSIITVVVYDFIKYLVVYLIFIMSFFGIVLCSEAGEKASVQHDLHPPLGTGAGLAPALAPD